MFELGRSLEHVRVFGVIHNHASFKWEVCFSWTLLCDLVVLISNNVMGIDGGPSTRSINVQMIQNNQETKSKATAISHLVENIQVDAPGYSSGFSPSFCYLISQA